MVPTDERGETSIIAVVIVLVLALTSALLIAAVGTLTLDQSKDTAEVEGSVRALTEFDTRASTVALEGGDAATMALGGRGGGVAVDDRGRLRLVLRDPENGTVTELVDTPLGTVSYRNGDQRVAYQGGGVWRRTTGLRGSVMVSPPEVHYRRGTLTLPMIRVVGDEHGLSRAAVRKVGSTDVYPTADRTNPVPAGRTLTLFVTSEYYRAWGAYFDRRIGGDVTVYDGNETVRVVLTSPVTPFSVGSGLISVGTSDRMEMTGSGGSPTFVDAFDSTGGLYDPTAPKNATVRGKGGLKMGGNTYINGTVDTGGSITFSGNDNTINGNAAYQGTISGLDDNRNEVTGWTAENGSGVEVPIIDGVVNDEVNSICDERSDDLSAGGTYGPGTYCHPEDLAIDRGETLTFDVSSGNVTVAVDGDLTVKGNLTVTGTADNDNVVKLWLGGDQVTLRGNNDETAGQVTVQAQDTPAFKLYGASDTSISMKAHATFQGLIYAPSTEGAGGGIELQGDSELFGSAVVGSVTMRSGSSVHYDEALGGYSFDHGGQTPAQRLSYLHVTINEIRVEEA